MTGFERYAPAIALASGTFGVAVPALFAAVVLRDGTPVTPEQYGDMVYEVPALVWAGLMVSFGGTACIAALMRWPVMATIALGLFFSLMIFFAAAAIMAGPTGTLVVAGAGAGVAPLSLCAAVVCWRGRHGE